MRNKTVITYTIDGGQTTSTLTVKNDELTEHLTALAKLTKNSDGEIAVVRTRPLGRI
jgi:hypothetical protein